MKERGVLMDSSSGYQFPTMICTTCVFAWRTELLQKRIIFLLVYCNNSDKPSYSAERPDYIFLRTDSSGGKDDQHQLYPAAVIDMIF